MHITIKLCRIDDLFTNSESNKCYSYNWEGNDKSITEANDTPRTAKTNASYMWLNRKAGSDWTRVRVLDMKGGKTKQTKQKYKRKLHDPGSYAYPEILPGFFDIIWLE